MNLKVIPMKEETSKKNILWEPAWVKWILVFVSVTFITLFLILPVTLVFVEGLKKGIAFYFTAISDPAAKSAIILTLTVAVTTVFFNTIFGLFASWAIAKFDFRGKTLLISLIDLPFSVSPVIAGLIFVLLFGRRSIIGQFLLNEYNLKIIFSPPGIVIATIFVTFPFVARELIPLMQEQGNDEEEAALLLGADGWKTFFKITLPKIKWGLLYGMVLCNARAIGEFGAVSVVSGHIRGLTNTIPLHVEILYSEYNFTASFAVASLLVLMAIFTLISKNLIGLKYDKKPSRT